MIGHARKCLAFLYRTLAGLSHKARGARLVDRWTGGGPGNPLPGFTGNDTENVQTGPLQAYHARQDDDPGMQKWLHFPEIYDRHLAKFVGRSPVVVEVGVEGGGSLRMWRAAFGPGCRVHGVDIVPGCVAHRGEGITVHIGDQGDRAMWKRFRATVPQVDILIDDGGHAPEQQMVTLEEMLPHLRPGGIYLCEDVHGIGNRFAQFVHALCDGLNAGAITTDAGVDAIATTPYQSSIHSVHLYPLVVLIEKRARPEPHFRAPLRGTQRRESDPLLGMAG